MGSFTILMPRASVSPKKAGRKCPNTNTCSLAKRLYHRETREKEQVLVQNDTRAIRGAICYFGPDGVKSSSPGLYLTASGRLIYVNVKGIAEQEIPGELKAYTSADGKITSCRVQENNLMRYYDADGSVRRQMT